MIKSRPKSNEKPDMNSIFLFSFLHVSSVYLTAKY